MHQTNSFGRCVLCPFFVRIMLMCNLRKSVSLQWQIESVNNGRIFTARQRSCGKVMFSVVSVRQSVILPAAGVWEPCDRCTWCIGSHWTWTTTPPPSMGPHWTGNPSTPRHVQTCSARDKSSCIFFQEGPEKPTKEEYAVAKFLRFNVPSREGKLVGMTVQYFIGKLSWKM